MGDRQVPARSSVDPHRTSALLAVIASVSLVASACGSPQPSSPNPPWATAGASAAATPQVTTAPVATTSVPTSQPPTPPAASPSIRDDDQTPDPNAAGYGLREPRAPARLAGTKHDLELAFHERFTTVAEGFEQEVWTIGGSVPGPVIRVRAGDTMRVHLVNAPPEGTYPAAHPARNDYAHSMEFHGSTGAWQDQRTPLEPLTEKTYEFTTEQAGVWLYHGNTEPVLESMINGMYGMMIVEPAGGLERVAQEFFFVQGEWYLGGPSWPLPPLPSLAKAEAAVPDPDFVVLNGVANQYMDHPILVAAGQRIRVFILNAGPNMDMSFRIEGMVFDRVVKEGVELTPGNGEPWGSQAVDLSPGQGAIVELTMPEDGLYPFHTHPLNLTGRGASGVFQVGDPGN